MMLQHGGSGRRIKGAPFLVFGCLIMVLKGVRRGRV